MIIRPVSKEKWILLILAAVQFTHIVDFMIMMPLGPFLMDLFGISPRKFSFLIASYTLSAAVTGLVVAPLIDQFDRKRALQFAYLGFLAGTLACAFSPDYSTLLISRIVAGAFGGTIAALILAIIGDVVPQQRRGKGVGIVMAAFSAAAVFGVPFGLYLAGRWSWHAPFFFLVLAGLLVMVAIHRLILPMSLPLPETLGQKPRLHFSLDIYRVVIRDNNALKALSLMVIMMLGHFSVIQFISPYMVSNVGLPESQLSLIYLVGGGLTIFSAPLIGKLSDRFGKPLVFNILIGISFIPVLFITQMGPSPLWVILLVSAFFFVVVSGRFIPMTAVITSAVPVSIRGGFMSLNSSVQAAGSGASALISGLIVTRAPDGQLVNYHLIGYLAVLMGLIASVVIWTIRPVKQIHHSEQTEEISPLQV